MDEIKKIMYYYRILFDIDKKAQKIVVQSHILIKIVTDKENKLKSENVLFIV